MQLVLSNVGNVFYTGQTSDINKFIIITQQRVVFPGGSYIINFDDSHFVIYPEQYSNYGINV